MQRTILLVDDDDALRLLLRDHLERNGYAVLQAADGAAMWKQLEAHQVDLIILDHMLPGDDGLTLCRDLRSRSLIGILMLTARGDELERIIGLEMGADDYLAKPFNPRELLARIKSLLRRSAGPFVNAAESARLCFSNWMLDLNARHLVDDEGLVVPLPSGEFRVLKELAQNANRVMSRDHLMEVLSGREAGPFDRTVDVMISRLRRRLRDDGREPAIIKTLRSEGYMFAAKVDRHA